MLINLQNELKTAASQLERSFSRTELAADLASKERDEDLKAAKLNAKYQTYIDKMQADFPHFGLGIYARELNRVIAVTDANTEKLKKKQYDERYFRIFETSKIEVQKISTSIDFGDQPIINVQYPIFVDGNLIGFTWAAAKTEDIQSAWNKMITRLSVYCFIMWLISILFVRLIFNRLFKAMNDLIIQIRQDNTSTDRFLEVPELLPLVNTINEQRAALERAYQQREKMIVEMERMNRLNLVGEMAASVAHEIRNPMTSVQGFLQFIKSGANEKTPEYMDIALNELFRANQIIDDFLSLARNRFVPKSPEILIEIIRRLEPIIYADCVKKGVRLEFILDDVYPIFASGKEIQQLILNLTRNALDAMDNNGCLTISTYCEDIFSYLVIADTGKGIPTDKLASIFEPFYTTKENGTGLGLVVCQSIVEHHGGNLKVDSADGNGTTFTIRFPMYNGG